MKKEKRGMSAWMWILIIVVLVLISIIVYMMVSGSSIPQPPALPDSASNVVAGGDAIPPPPALPSDKSELTAKSVDLSKCINLKTPSNLEYYKSLTGEYGEQYRYDAYGKGIFCPSDYVLASTTPSLCPESNPYLGETLILGSSSDPKSKGYYGVGLGKTLTFKYYSENDPSIIYRGIQYSCLSRDYALDTKRVSVNEVEAVCCQYK